MANAQANARLAVMLALGELQKAAGDDRRITANGSIIDDAKHPHAVDIWKSWSHQLSAEPTAGAPDYAGKSQKFVTWLVSGCAPGALASPSWLVPSLSAQPRCVLLTLAGSGALARIVASWKRFSAVKIHHQTDNSGALWQKDHFDRMIRDWDHFMNVARYIRRNPLKAKLRQGEFLLEEADWIKRLFA